MERDEMMFPQGWAWTTIGEVAVTTSGGTPSRKRPDFYGGNVPWVKSGELNDDVVSAVEEFITQQGLENSNAKIFPHGTALVALYGATVGKTGILGIDAATNQAICAIFPLQNVFISKYLQYWLRSQRQTLISMSSGGAQPNISQAIIRSFPFPLAPFPEQHRIVAEIEKQFTRLDAGVAALRRAQANLKRYKAAVLKAACEGRLVPQDPNDEPASKLLEHILEQRKGAVTAPRRKYAEPAPPDTEGLPELPEGWCWASVEQSASSEPRSIQSGPFGSELHHSEFQDSGVLAIGIDNVLEGHFSKGREHRISPKKFEELRKFSARPLDVLITVMATVGRCCVVPADLEPAIITKHVYRISANPAFMNPYYLMFSLLSFNVRQQILERVQGQTRPGINGEILKGIAIPVPPLSEQRRIVAEVERRLSVVQKVEAVIAANLARAERLRQSVLKQAFEGKLVPQDHNDEPASVLLERIRAQRKGQEETRETRRRKS